MLLLPLTILARPAAAMTFTLLADPDVCGGRACILAEGLIDQDSVGQFDAFIRQHRIERGAMIALNSEGGVVIDGVTLGEHIRKAGLATVALGPSPDRSRTAKGCASACVFSFLGGTERSVGSGARIGVHQIYCDPRVDTGLSISDVQLLSALIAQHIERMGGSEELLIVMLRTPPQDIDWLSSPELARLKVTTAMSTSAGSQPTP